MDNKIEVDDKTRLRFWSKVKIFGTYDCWEWQGVKNSKGYGEFWNKIRERKTRAHQLSWIIYTGLDIPEGMCVCHKCDNPSCVNPSHLFLGTNKENMEDMDRKGRRVTTVMCGEEHPQHGTHSKFSKLDENKVRKIRELRATTKMTLREIGNLFGVSQGLVNNILHGRKWSWLK